MKKVLLLTGIMALSMATFAATTTTTTAKKFADAVEGVVNVKAKVVAPLQIVATHLDFGTMIQGEEITHESNVPLDILGTTGEKLLIEIKTSEEGEYVKYTGSLHKFNVILKTGTGATDNEKLTTKLSMFTAGAPGDDTTNGIYVLEAGNKKEFMIGGTATASATQKEGDYTGKLYIRAKYY
ncbi:DUF4402 domain-containing protein [Fusobacterium perfoetens]|uniref:DUF4402 domain-containing protein n=1 Tax=Fusobacterium perfoetens TaxID=852 RepID=UPI001F27E3B6|nr:DUF4402 domain-containing protein [Fusobacterium perfoetens]MCF2612390.1 DUF4402 domain-containing protein [Fusobacterium perfoetens]